MKKIGKKTAWGTVATAAAAAVSAGVLFFVRGGFARPLFALSDALSVSGFFLLVISLLPSLFGGEAFDGFSYAFRCGVQGIFFAKAIAYDDFKRRRREKSRLGVCRVGVRVGGAFLSAGVFFSLFFL